MKTVHEVSRITGISVRTLHHYDKIGLLNPAEVTQAGYRLYDEKSLEKLQSILFLKELRFTLKEISSIVNSPNFDFKQALSQQIELLEIQRDRLNEIILLARRIKDKGVIEMEFSVFDKKKLDEYAAEAREKWGNTDAYREFEDKTKESDCTDMLKTGNGLMSIFTEIGKKQSLPPESEEIQSLIKKLRDFINENYYTCTDEILLCLGEMYTADDRFRENIDNAGGEGTAEFTGKAIKAFCGK